jgi:hypothetical protein
MKFYYVADDRPVPGKSVFAAPKLVAQPLVSVVVSTQALESAFWHEVSRIIVTNRDGLRGATPRVIMAAEKTCRTGRTGRTDGTVVTDLNPMADLSDTSC